MTRILIIFGFLLFGMTKQTATACSCAGESTVEEGFNNADIVVVGNVVDTEAGWFPDSTRIKEMVAFGFHLDSLDRRLYGNYLTKITVKIDIMYKRQAVNNTLIIYTGMGGGDCGFRFKEGQKYIIYGDADSYFGDFFKDHEVLDGQKIYWTNICTRTQEHNRKEIKEIEKIKN